MFALKAAGLVSRAAGLAMEGLAFWAAAGMAAPVYFNPSHKSGEELFWYVAPEAPQFAGIRLLEALEQAARASGCQTWQMKSLARLNGDRMVRLYERRGYRVSEQIFIKRF